MGVNRIMTQANRVPTPHSANFSPLMTLSFRNTLNLIMRIILTQSVQGVNPLEDPKRMDGKIMFWRGHVGRGGRQERPQRSTPLAKKKKFSKICLKNIKLEACP